MVQDFRQQLHVKHAVLRSVVALTSVTSDILDCSAVVGNCQRHIGVAVAAGDCTVDLKHLHELLCPGLECCLSSVQCYCVQSDCQASNSAVQLALDQYRADVRCKIVHN